MSDFLAPAALLAVGIVLVLGAGALGLWLFARGLDKDMEGY